ncbi:MAG: VWA domain-containing protein [Rhodobacterales bacterium]|nr:VWA domain-containing protein [Rhodobacterales bacterium]
MQKISSIIGQIVGTVAMASPILVQADMVLSKDATAEQIYQYFRQQHPSHVEDCFPDLELVAGPGALSPKEEGGNPTWRRAVIALDASGSMAGQAGGQVKMRAATEAVTRFVASLPEEVEIGLVVFGHEGTNDEDGKAKSCEGVKTLVPARVGAAEEISEALDTVEPTGWTPLATAIETAGRGLAREAEEGAQVVFVVSDGEETCGGDPVEAARSLHASGAHAIVNVIGFDLPAGERARLAEVAKVSGGVYLDAANGDEVMDALQRHNAWIKDRYDHTVDNVRAKVANGTNSFVAKNEAAKCVADIQNAEYSEVSDWIRDLRAQGHSSKAYMDFRELVISDHKDSKDLLDGYRAEIDARADKANLDIEETIVPPGLPLERR